MAAASALNAANDLDALLVGPWTAPAWLIRARIPLVFATLVVCLLLPLTFSGGVVALVSGIIVGAVLATGAVVIFLIVMQWKSGTRLIGYSTRGVFVPGGPEPLRWDRVARVHTGRSTSQGRVISLDLDDTEVIDIPIPSTVTEPEYRAFLAALAEALGERN